MDFQVGKFAAGKSFMIQQGSWNETAILNVNPSIHLGMLPLVFDTNVKASMTISQWWIINAKASAPKKEEAAKLLNYLYFTKKGQQLMGTAGIVPSSSMIKGVTVKNKIENAASIYTTKYESAHTQFPKFFNNANADLTDAFRTSITAGSSGDDAFIAALVKAWNQTK